MNNIYLFQPQYSVEVRGEDNYWLPYSVACLWSYCSQFDDINENFILKDLIFKREHPDKLLNKMEDPFLCAFSCYVWNENYCLTVAKLIKEKWPNCIIEFGGPQATKKMIDENNFIDCIMIGGDGEHNFLDLLRTSISGESIKKIYEKGRIENLDFQSPYQSGIFDRIVKENPGIICAAILETNRGCPFRCTYCDWGGTIMSKIQKFGLERVKEDIDWMIYNNVGFIILGDANVGIFAERDLEIAKMLKAAGDHPNSIIDDIVLQYSKHSTEVVFEITSIMGRFARRGVTISVQSMNEPTLKAIKRHNIRVKDFKKNMELAKKWGVRTYSDFILGLPEETLESWKEGFCTILEHGQHESIDVWFCQVFGNAELNSTLNREVYGIKTVKAEDYVSFTNTKDCVDIKETTEIINETNTMTTEELVEAYLYAWMIVQFHINGYSQIIAKYYRYVKNISYREFYDKLFEVIKNDPILFGNHYHKIYNRLYKYLKTGKVIDTTGHALEVGMATDYSLFWDNKDHTFNLIFDCWNVDKSICKLQEEYVYNPEVNYPIKLTASFDMDTWSDNKITEYKIYNPREEKDRYDMWLLYRIGLNKNYIEKYA